MGPQAGLPKLSRLSIILFVSAILPSTQASHLFLRDQQQQCGGMKDLQQCGGDLPASFCCGTDMTCMRVNSTQVQSVICCPNGKDCSAIQPVPCDVTQYNATLHPDNQIHISNTNIELPKCGDSCCPLGYKCNGGMCAASKEVPSASPQSPTPSPTNPASSSQTSGCSDGPSAQTSQVFNGNSFAAGFFPGILIGAFGVLGVMWLIKKRRKSDDDDDRYSGDFGHVARTISDPIYDPMYAARTDFIRRGSQSVQSTPTPQKNIGTRTAGGASGLTPRIKSMWDRTPKLAFNGWNGLPANPAPPPPAVRAGDRDPYMTPGQTPQQRASKRVSKGKRPLGARSTSSETIDVLMPAPSFLEPPKAPGMRENRFTQDSGHTTFTKLMERAGYGDDSRDHVRNYEGSPAKPR